MRTIRTKVYKFDELSKTAKNKVIENYRNVNYQNNDYAWLGENRDTLNAFAKLFPVNIKDWSYGGQGEGVYFSFTGSDEIENLTGVRLATYIWNNYKDSIYTKKYYSICNGIKNCIGQNSKSRHSNIELDELGCPFTGYCMDNEIIAPLFEFMRSPSKNTDFKDLLELCFNAWVKACNEDINYQNSDEYIINAIQSNEYEFTIDGRMI